MTKTRRSRSAGLGLFAVKIPVPCDCGEKHQVEIDLTTAQYKVTREEKKWEYRAYAEIHDLYKAIKGFDAMPTYDSKYRARNFSAIKKLLNFFVPLDEPVDVAKEFIRETAAAADQAGWSWTLETCVKRAPHWLAEKMKKMEAKRK